MPSLKSGIVLPKAQGAASIRTLGRRLSFYGKNIPILPIVMETPTAAFVAAHNENAKPFAWKRKKVFQYRFKNCRTTQL
jgi:hypothetical protein